MPWMNGREILARRPSATNDAKPFIETLNEPLCTP